MAGGPSDRAHPRRADIRVDIRAKAEMANALRAAVEQYGLAILLVNSELDEMTSLPVTAFLCWIAVVSSTPPRPA